MIIAVFWGMKYRCAEIESVSRSKVFWEFRVIDKKLLVIEA